MFALTRRETQRLQRSYACARETCFGKVTNFDCAAHRAAYVFGCGL
jgi:hypothetical protein